MSVVPNFASRLLQHIMLRIATVLAIVALAMPVAPLAGIGLGSAEAGQNGSASKSIRMGHRSSGAKRSSGHKSGYHVRSVGKKYKHGRDHYAKKREGEYRSGVKYRSHSVKVYSGPSSHKVSPNRKVVTKTRLHDPHKPHARYGHNKYGHGKYGHGKYGHGKYGGHKVARGFHGSGALIITIVDGHAGGMHEIAGNGSGAADCAYGSYCTIDLGGPKIITYNDVADVVDGELVDGMSEEEYMKKYGSK